MNDSKNGIGCHINGNGATGVSGVPPQRHEPAPLACPACGSPVTREEYDRILRLDQAREAQVAEELAALAREKEEIDLRRTEIAEAAAAEESAKWEVEAQRIARSIAQMKTQAAAEQRRVEREHKKELQVTMRAVAKMETQIASADAKAKAQIAKAEAAAAAKIAKAEEAAIAMAKREANEAQSAEIVSLRAELKTVERRRSREAQVMQKTIFDLKQRAEARDVEHLGIEGEENLIEMLKDEFPLDVVEHHGVGGDVVHRVVDNGKPVATIVYECKNRGAWQGAFVKQTLGAMEKHKTTHGVLVTRRMPARKIGMTIIDGVIVAEPSIAAQVVSVLRSGIVAIARLEASETDKAAKASALVKYVRGDEFVGAMQRVALNVRQLVSSLSRERASHQGWWRTRELGYASVLREVVGVDARVSELLQGAGGPANDNGKTKKMEKGR